jgi:riboflavin kinase, archaea type
MTRPKIQKERKKRIKIRGRIVEGLGVGRDFTRIPWVKAQFISRLSIDPYPGTLNLEITDPEDLRRFEALKKTKGVEIPPEDPSFCKGICYPVLINGKLKGAIVLPDVGDYPKGKLELITSENAKEALSVKTGDLLEVEVF